MKRGVGERTVPGALPPLARGAAPAGTDHQGIAGERLIHDLLSIGHQPRFATLPTDPDPTLLRLGREQPYRPLLQQGVDQIFCRLERFPSPKLLDGPAALPRL